jgi:uncharacterized membrane protein
MTMTNANASSCCAGQGQSTNYESSSAFDILAERFARGEIDKAELEEKRKILAGLREEAGPASGKECCC